MEKITDEQIKQMQKDGVGLIPVVKLIREKEGVFLGDAKRRCDAVGGKWKLLDDADSSSPDYKGRNSETFQKIKSEMADRLISGYDPLVPYKNMIRELLAWAESVEGQKVSRNITKTPDSIFEQARKLLKSE